MNRRKFFQRGSLLAVGSSLLNPFGANATPSFLPKKSPKTAKNIIIVVSDGMSTGTLNMADIHLSRKTGLNSNWIQLYQENLVSRGLMDMASASSIVTDSAAASSSWGSGERIRNGSLNVSTKGEDLLPIWQKFKKAGKMAGCVTTVPITHATPAGFCVSSKSRNSQEEIAEKYLEQRFDIMMGGGKGYFSADSRADKKDLLEAYRQAGFEVLLSKADLNSAKLDKPVLGVFQNDALPYSLDRENNKELKESTPSLAEMTEKAIEKMKNHPKGFVLQVEAGKVDWAAHANDIGGLLYDQLAHDEALKVAIDFAKKDGNTLVIATTDHGNANPGLIYGSGVNANFDTLNTFKHTNEWILNGIGEETSVSQVNDRVEYATGYQLTKEEGQELLGYYSSLEIEEGVYNPRHLPFKLLSEIQQKRNSVGWISMDHSADYVEIAMYGPGSELLTPFIKNTDLHFLMLKAAEVENKF
ncbi:alkaline phosphatase [Algoriphagus sp. NG3]|uniref:alkaline phosphatase n=1 Tax=unclassified Algoriphagus TaxID=2641541 RepID=UPI002A82B904|nr:alkaline phosphatase [Algoriphagus sp. NG3]WPR76743.1 alkaline phosphatase [Algoriphagus sp. NG3]